ncbi:MAG: hypothetical protein HQM13_09765 [SAR324 cluster bacterium]|nr:hypothetical protein [SAR324 cluster bacterium]
MKFFRRKPAIFLKRNLKNVFVLSLLFFTAPSVIVAGSMPEFTQTSPEMWVNSAPLSKSDLSGKVVLIEVWTSV